jgi:two-component system response regulator AtoC/two-component system nitrogen regulation response regulator NtrX
VKVDAEAKLATDPKEDAQGIVGISTCFREAVEEMGRIIRLPYGMVSGESGVGKMHLIQSLWRQVAPQAPLVVLPCGSFFRDYYIGGTRRRFGGGREAVDQLGPYLDESEEGLLVLHHVERLPTALQEELVARLLLSSSKGMKNPVIGVDRQALVEHDVRILATSTRPPEELRNRGLIDELAVKLAKRHVRIPSLAQRGPEDVELICHDILRRIVCRQTGGQGDWAKLVPQFEPAAMGLLRQAQHPDNISDLLRWIEYGWRHCRGGTIRRCHLPPDLAIARRRPAGTLDETVANAQRAAIQNALDQTGNDMSEAAALLGRNKGALYRLMGTLGMTQAERDQ